MQGLYDEFNSAMEQMTRLQALLYYHLTKALVERVGRETAVEIIAEGIHNYGLERGALIRQAAEAADAPPNVGNLLAFYDRPAAPGTRPEPVMEPDWPEARFEHEISEGCPFAQVWLDKDWAEIGHLYCAVDFAIREGYNPAMRFQRLQNVLTGDNCCESVSCIETDQ